jgi:hypothetical protein
MPMTSTATGISFFDNDCAGLVPQRRDLPASARTKNQIETR